MSLLLLVRVPLVGGLSRPDRDKTVSSRFELLAIHSRIARRNGRCAAPGDVREGACPIYFFYPSGNTQKSSFAGKCRNRYKNESNAPSHAPQAICPSTLRAQILQSCRGDAVLGRPSWLPKETER